MFSKIFVNLPVKDLNKSISFFTKLGFEFNPQFTDENANIKKFLSNIKQKRGYANLIIDKVGLSYAREVLILI